MHFSKTHFAGAVVLGVTTQVFGHAAVAPVLGVQGTAKRTDVQRPSTASPCGKTNLQQTLDTSQVLQAAADGSVSTTATNFNPKLDGSLQFSVKFSPTASAGDMVPGTITTNGPREPPKSGTTVPIVAQLPPGMQCTGGATGDMCLASFVSASGFGNCVAVRQAPAVAALAPLGAAPAVNVNGAAAANAAANAAAAANGLTAAANAAAAANGQAATSNANAAAAAPAFNVVNVPSTAAPVVVAPGAAPPVAAPVAAPPVVAAAGAAPPVAQSSSSAGSSSSGVVSSFASSSSSGGNTNQVIAVNNGNNGVVVTKTNNGPAQVIAGRTLLPRLYRAREAAMADSNTDSVVVKRSWSSWMWA